MNVVKGKKIAQTTKMTLITFFLLIVIGGVLLNLPIANIPGKPHNYLNSFFMATSAACVAGLTTIVPAEQFTMFGKIVLLCLIQIGALGYIFVISSIVFFTKKKLSFKEKISVGTILGTPEKLNKVKSLIKRIIIFTAISEIVGAVLLAIRFVPTFGLVEGIWQSIFTSISAFCNCGLDLLGSNSLVDYSTDYLVVIVCAVQTVLGGLGFLVLNELYEKIKTKKENRLSLRKTWLTLSTHTKLVLTMLVIMILVGTFGFMIFEFNNSQTLGQFNFGDKLFVSMFHGISSRTTGIAILDLANMTNSGKLFTIIMMIIGGNPGSTSGGLKTVTIAVLFITMISSASNNKSVNVYRREIPDENIKQAITVLISAILIITVMTMVLCSLNPAVPLIDMMFEVVSALATCGYSLGVTASLTAMSKFLLIIIMYIGRVSTVTMAMAVVGKKFKQSNIVDYPKDNVVIG